MPSGGARPGAGRPRSLSREIKENKQILAKLVGGAEAGYDYLADKYPKIMELAVELALGGEDDEGKKKTPNIPLLKELLLLVPKIVGQTAISENDPLRELMEDLIAARTTASIESGMDNDVRDDIKPLDVRRPGINSAG